MAEGIIYVSFYSKVEREIIPAASSAWVSPSLVLSCLSAEPIVIVIPVSIKNISLNYKPKH